MSKSSFADKVEYINHRGIYGNVSNVFQVKIKNSFVFMRLNSNNRLEGTPRVIIIERNCFLSSWKNEPYSVNMHLACGNEKTWRSDLKFDKAEWGFSQGIENPVPIAQASFGIKEQSSILAKNIWIKRIFSNKNSNRNKTLCCVIIDGITRIIWLLANGAEYFPIMTDENSYEKIKGFEGVYPYHEVWSTDPSSICMVGEWDQ